MAKDFGELLEQYMDKKKMYRLEGRTGVITLCSIARVIGYKDPQYFGTLNRDAALGDLNNMLEDNPGMIEAIIEWMKQQNVPEWKELISFQLTGQE